MPEMRSCQVCGAPVPADAPLRQCPKCLLQLGRGPGPPEVAPLASFGVDAAARHFGDYEIIEQIGRGGMGVVYRARQRSLKRLVALKMISPQAFSSPSAVDRFVFEAQTAASLHHPNIVTIHDVGERDGQPFFSMELVDGASMEKHITPSGFRLSRDENARVSDPRESQKAIARIINRLAWAVHDAHRHGVLHRDIKPANILIDAHGEPHLTDFGLALLVSTEGVSAGSTIAGTPSFMAPEQVAGRSLTIATDVHGLGGVLYAMLTGRAPFLGDTPLRTMEKVVNEEATPPATIQTWVDADLATICLKCLEKDPRQRYGSAAALAEDLERWLRGEPIEAKPVGAWGRVYRWCRREPVLAGMTSGLFLLLAATAVFATVALQVQKQRTDEADHTRQAMLYLLNQRLEDEWQRFGVIKVTAEEQSLIRTGRLPTDKRGSISRRILLGVYSPGVRDDPGLVVERFFPIIQHLEASAVSVPFHLDLFAYRHFSNAVEALALGRVALMQASPAQFVAARQIAPGLSPMVAQEFCGAPETSGAIFARKSSGIDRIADLKGHTFVFGDPQSTIANFVPKAELTDHGIHSSSLLCTNRRSVDVVNSVLTGEFAAGVAEWNDVAATIERGPLKLLKRLRSPNFVWVAATNLPPEIATAIKECLLDLRDLKVLGKVPGLTGFLEPRPGDYDELERQMDKARRFDRPQLLSPR